MPVSLLQKNPALDLAKYAAAIIIVSFHALPLFGVEALDVFYGQWFARACVPLFLISSGYFFAQMDQAQRLSYLRRVTAIYAASTLLYLPMMLIELRNASGGTTWLLRNLILGYYHLWYLSALTVGLAVWLLCAAMPTLRQHLRRRYPVYAILLLLSGALLDEYYKLVDVAALNQISQLVGFLGGSRHALLFGIPLLLVGRFIGEHQEALLRLPLSTHLLLGALTAVLGLAECTFLYWALGAGITNDVTLLNYAPAVFVFIASFYLRAGKVERFSRRLRKNADLIYIIHPWVIFLTIRLLGLHGLPLGATAIVCSAAGSAVSIALLSRLRSLRSHRSEFSPLSPTPTPDLSL
ncbi:Uncharacterized protein conserved in bacteria [Actinomyces bovis]|uniref:Uncharacterized protein conserved in bacteria n=1 Tax=Actinomyces bovis TaxID=1658 RepID=A0ABY1VMU1_9ACTO|nr:acyltransferase family protein [Actinomyces bovis]SPT53380.1 Uncharacterized protein conserved in bacteria [Actinomyces bovis]VEG52776.1 Uncharacterized protein conserved in bacteria [Actinomyces israelii]